MLDQLDNVPWHSLTHAYGEASDVPGQIRALTSSVEQRREEALSQLYGNVFHQGTRWEASPFVVPFLYELVELTRERRSIMFIAPHHKTWGAPAERNVSWKVERYMPLLPERSNLGG